MEDLEPSGLRLTWATQQDPSQRKIWVKGIYSSMHTILYCLYFFTHRQIFLLTIFTILKYLTKSISFISCFLAILSCSQTFSSPKKKLCQHTALPTPHHHPNPLSHHQSTFCQYGFACAGHFTEMESYNLWPLAGGFFRLAPCLGDAPRLGQYQNVTCFRSRGVSCHVNMPHCVHPSTA